MATVPFPPYKPTRVSLQLPNYRVLPNSWRSIEAPELLGNFPEGAILRLEYDSIKHDEALSLLLLSNATAGGKFAFDSLPGEIAAGIDDENFAKRILDIDPLVWALNTAVGEESIKNKRSGIVVELVSELRTSFRFDSLPDGPGGPPEESDESCNMPQSPEDPRWPEFFGDQSYQVFDFENVPRLSEPSIISTTTIGIGPTSILYLPGFFPDPCTPAAGVNNAGGLSVIDYTPICGFVRIFSDTEAPCDYRQLVQDWYYTAKDGFKLFTEYLAPGGLGTGMSPESVYPDYLSLTHQQVRPRSEDPT